MLSSLNHLMSTRGTVPTFEYKKSVQYKVQICCRVIMADQQSSSTAAETSATTRPISCSSANNDPKQSRGRPRKQAPMSKNWEVSIEGKEFAVKTMRFDFKRESVLFSLCVPNRLLLE